MVFSSFLKEPFISRRSNHGVKIPIDPTKLKPDLVIIVLEKPFDLSPARKLLPACLPIKPIKAGTKCYVSGKVITEKLHGGRFL